MSRYYKDGIAEEVYKRFDGKCCNCKSTENLVIHHAVPISRGGSDEITNLVLICDRCHRAFHYGQNVVKYRTGLHMGGRPRGLRDDNVFWDFIHAEITGAEAVEKLGYAKSYKISNNPNFQDFLKENGIVKLKRPPYYSEIEFEDGRTEAWHRGFKM